MLGSLVRCPLRAHALKRSWARRPLRIAVAAIAGGVLLALDCPAGQVSRNSGGISIGQHPTTSTQTDSRASNVRVDVTMILIPVTVTDRWERPVTDLPAESFHLYEDNVEQKIASVFREDGPVSVGFIFDSSGSMKKRMAPSVSAIQQFFSTAMNGDEFFLVKFTNQADLIQHFTSAPEDILGRLSSLQPYGWTALLDAIYMGVQEMKHARNSRRALFVLTDGLDNSSCHTEPEIIRLIRESDVRVFAIGLFERPEFLEKLSVESGGKAYLVRKLKDLPAKVERLSSEIRNQYVLGYYTKNQNDDGKHHIR